ncbi:MAG TPA: DNA/RNA helicase domain-containing protein, partial [Pseudonocardiaceae bacterium]|nr:DNA/RNA helicase domain-containing protein [Pseudonocardiaceae bacterium]
TGRSQVEELITAAKVSVFFLDETQAVRPGETGSLATITEAAERLGRGVQVVRLNGRFHGSESFDTWVTGLLGPDVQPTSWSDLAPQAAGEFVVHSSDSPQEMESWLLSQQAKEGGTARITAGFCWSWSDPVTKNGTKVLVPDVQIGDWRRPWSVKPDRSVTYAPSGHFWASEERGFGQVGCIYTAQGFEYDWAGVIFGKDFVWRGDRWVARREHSYDSAVKRANEPHFGRLIRNAYKVLLTRGMRGVCVYSVDPETQDHLRAMVE